MKRNQYRAYKVSETKIHFTNERTNQFFDVILENDNVVDISSMRFCLPKTQGEKMKLSDQDALFQTVKEFIVSEIGEYSCDGYPIRVYHSAAGYYIGCYCEDGPYCRLSGYAECPEEAWCFLHERYVDGTDEQ